MGVAANSLSPGMSVRKARGEARRAAEAAAREAKRKSATHLLAEGASIAEIATAWGQHPVSVRQFLRENGIIPGHQARKHEDYRSNTGRRCSCGLLIDRDHQQETCDLNEYASNFGIRRAVWL